MKILLIEDEQLAAEKLIRQLGRVVPNAEVLSTTHSIETSIAFLKKNRPDLILSDIHLADGLSFSIFESTRTDIPVIFTTAYDQYAIQAFKANSIDYLLKPVTKSALEIALQKFKRIHEKTNNPIDYAELIRSFASSENQYKSRFLVQETGSLLKSIPVEEIAYFFADGKYTFLVTREGKKHFSESNITTLKVELEPRFFFQINRKFIIHINSIAKMVKYSKSRLKLDLKPPSETDVIVSVDRSPEFKIWLGK